MNIRQAEKPVQLNVKDWQQNWQRELEGSYLYAELEKLAREPGLKKALGQMAEQETTHAKVWAELARQAVPGMQTPGIDLRIRLTLLMARWLGVESVLGLLINDEVSDIASYTDQATESGDKALYQPVLKDETTHARTLAKLRNPEASTQTEPWHRGASASGFVRDMVYGFNDGLTANFGLVMGVVGASVNNRIILLTGFAGLLADALSMAASGFLASRSEQEVRQFHLALEKAELELMPQEEREELVGFFTSKGLTRQEAATVADRLMQKPDVALTQLAREELGIDPEAIANPLMEGVRTGLATALGAVIPIIPFLFLSGPVAIWTGIGVAMLAHFAVGASRAIFTGRPAIRSGFEMFVVGMGVALATYLLGTLVGVKL
ncbi:MAG: VIT1/CCC1 transporter family protein [Anaerolineaceae bacterium]|nr:VIT1/CCC1 transporter family protein [Anaerolineaceae bacterium]